MVFVSDLSVPEGPVLLPDGTWLIVEMGPDRGCVTHISADGNEKRVVAKTGRPNGLAVGGDGTIWVAESKTPSLLKMTLDGEAEVFLDVCDGETFLFPNDLAFGPDGALYMTDSGTLIDEWAPGGTLRPDYAEVVTDGRVYRVDTESGEIQKLDSGLQFTNGITFDAHKNLYVNESLTGMVHRYAWGEDGLTGDREEFGNVVDPDAPDGLNGPDGMKFGLDGKLYVTVFGQGDVTVLDESGTVTDRLKTEGNFPTNLVFGPPGSQKIYVTEDQFGTLEVFDVGTDGLELYG